MIKEALVYSLLVALTLLTIVGIASFWQQADTYTQLKKQTAELTDRVKKIESFREGFLEGKKALIKQQEDLGVIITQVPKVQTK